MTNMVVGPDQMPDWLEKRRTIFGELDRQLIQGLRTPGQGLSLAQLQVVVEHRNPFGFPNIIKLGTFKTEAELRSAIEEAGGNVSDYSKDIMSKPAFTLASQEIDVEPVIVSGSDLGLTGSATRQTIYELATSADFGYLLCPAEVGPQLRLQYLSQPKGEWLLIAMEPITASDGLLRVFGVERGDGGEFWLRVNCGRAGSLWDPEVRWVFLRPRK